MNASTSLWVEERDGSYVGDTTAIGGTQPHLDAFAFGDHVGQDPTALSGGAPDVRRDGRTSRMGSRP